MSSGEDQFISIIDDSKQAADMENNARTDLFSWHVLIVDDEKVVHDATTLALMHENIFGCPITLHHAYSAEEGFSELTTGPRFVVALIDVVMETKDAGLKLIQQIRENGYDDLRIIVRTGQPGYAPELSVLTTYDINDYRTKTELTKTKLVSVLISAIRSFQQIDTISSARRGLELIINAASDLLQQQNIEKFGNGVLTQITALLGGHTSGIVCVADNKENLMPTPDDYRIICSTGSFNDYRMKRLSEIEDVRMHEHFHSALKEKIITTDTGSIAMHISPYKGNNAFIYINCGFKLSEDNIALLRLFGMNIFACFNNINLIKKLDNMAYKDHDTGFPNMNALKKELVVSLEQNRHVALIMIHFDGLGKMFSLFGSDIFNQVSNEIYLTLSRKLAGARIIARSTRGDFAALLDAEDYDKECVEALRFFPVKVNQSELRLTTTIATSSSCGGDCNPEELMQRVIFALILGKTEHRGYLTEYNNSIASKLRERIAIQYHMRESFITELSPIEVFLQPKFDTVEKKFVGAEALSRWKMNGAYISPGIFIPIIEESGLSVMLEDILLKSISEWQHERLSLGYPLIPVSMNLSMKDIPQKNYAEDLLGRTMELNLTPDMLEFEITEGVMMYNTEQAINELLQIKKAGYRIAFDDFGTGYSSLSYLNRLPVNILKIDRAFITPLNPLNARRSIVATIIAMAETIGLQVVAEGIETEEHSRALQFLGCNICQGFLFGKPVNIHEFNSSYYN